MNLNQKTVRLSRLALFSALILLLNYTPLGYIRVFALEITLIIIPVTLGAMLLGPADGAILGAAPAAMEAARTIPDGWRNTTPSRHITGSRKPGPATASGA